MIESNYINLLRNYKGKTVEELIDILEHKNNEEQEKENIRRKNYEEYFNSLTGKYFRINFNGFSYIFIHINKPIDVHGKNNYEVYNIHISKEEVMIKKELIREINKSWFLNPYEKEKYYGRAVLDITEISEEEYNEIVEEFNILNVKFKNFV